MSKFKKIVFPLILVLLTLFICFKNYSPNTFLTGWDTLHPEFNFPLNLKRIINIWHSEQGLGSIPAHAQISELPRLFVLWLFNFIFPVSFLRYSYIFLMFILGPLGIYFLINFIFKKTKHKNLIAFIGALLYIFNLSTIQQFYVPFEMFPTQWAFLPFIILFSLKFLSEKKLSNLIIFSILTIFAAPQAYASQLWYAFFIIYSLFLIIYSILKKEKKAITLIVLTFLLNAFWLIPNLFYIFTSSSIPQINRDNRLYSQEYLLRNRDTGTLSDSTLIKGFYFDWSIYDFDRNRFESLMPQWQKHFNKPFVLTIGYTIFIISFLGLIISFIKKDKLFISLSPFIIIPFILLSNKVIFFSNLFEFLIKSSTIKESFRFIFSKLSILFLFGIVIFFSYSLKLIFQKIKFHKIIPIISIIISVIIIIYTYPILQGNLISTKVRTEIPNEYFKTWEFMSKKDDGRILTLPLNQSSGWQYYNWGYQGSGFLWFNLKQNLLDRDSDRWSNQNEQSYKEFFNSLYSQNTQQFFQTLKKYKINYIIWDQNLTYSSSKNNDQIIFKKEIEQLLTQLENENKIEKINQFESIYIFKINDSSSNIEIKDITSFVEPNYKWSYFDAANDQEYISETSNYNNYYPFRDILNIYQKIDTEKIIIQKNNFNQWTITLKNPNLDFQEIPSLISKEKTIFTAVYFKKDENYSKLLFELPLPRETTTHFKTEFSLPKDVSKIQINNTTLSINDNLDLQFLGFANIFTNSDNYLNNKIIDFEFIPSKVFYLKNISFTNSSLDFPINRNFKDTKTNGNYSIDLFDLPHNSGYILAIKSKHTSGIPLRICLKNIYSFLCSIEDEVNRNDKLSWDYFLIPSTGDNFGYTLSINNISYGEFTSESFLEQISIIPIPFNLLSQIKSSNQNLSPMKYLFLNQSFHKGWLAFHFEGLKPVFLKNHVLANNWANAWELPNNNIDISQIHIIFWPQIFQFIGFGITILVLIKVIKKK